MWILYDILFLVFSVLYVPAFALKGKFGPGSGARFGVIPVAVRKRLTGREVTWIHAVSVGEVGAALTFADRIRESDASAKIVLTTTTVTGHGVAARIKNEEDELLYFPVDWPWAVRSFVDAVRPRRVVFFETEIWPNLMRELSRRGVGAFIVNGRISDRAWGPYRKVRFFMGRVLRLFSGIGVQDETMRKRFVELGADPLKVRVTGNLKFDSAGSAREVGGLVELATYLRSGGARLWVAGSTREGEEALLGGVFKKLKARHPDWRLLVAPRHLQRIAAVEKDLAKHGFNTLRVRTGSVPVHPGTEKDVFILDEMGVLASLYRWADAVFIGGSLVPTGGHNPVEPARYGKPVLYGPYMTNFRSMAEEFARSQAAVQVADAEGLSSALERLMSDPARREELGRRAKELVERHRGASRKNLDLVMNAFN